MNSIKEIVDNPPRSNYTGSVTTRECVKKQIEERWGKEAADQYDPYTTYTFAKWASMGYRIKPQERAFKSVTYITVKQADGTEKTYKKAVSLFLPSQVKKVRY